MKKSITTLVLVFACIELFGAVSIVPRPLELERTDARFVLTADTLILYRKAGEDAAEFLRDRLKESTGYFLKVKRGRDTAENAIMLKLTEDNGLGAEGYGLKVTDERVNISAPTETGLFYGVQTLLQLLPPEVYADKVQANMEWGIDGVVIKDKPRFAWRAFMLDEARNFKGMEVVKDLLDEMSILKMNVFHWHLVDDQGWRIEIKKYPKLTGIGSKREDTQVGGWHSERRTGVPQEGFYTQKQIKEIVKYAAERHIAIVPEIEMPGHASAALAAYPEWSTNKEKIEVPVTFGKKQACFNPADEKVYKALSEILDEVVELFPGPVIHIGGDEVRFNHWKASKEVAELMEREGLNSLSDVQTYFTNRMSHEIAKKGRRMMGWNEILGRSVHNHRNEDAAKSKSLSKDAIVHFWKGSAELAEKAIMAGYDVVNSWHKYSYLDYGYGRISLQDAYDFDPVFKGLEKKDRDKVMGFGCQMWGEWIGDVPTMEKKIYPRIAAYAEVGWTGKARKDYKDFLRRAKVQKLRWDRNGVASSSYALAVVYEKEKLEAKGRKIAEWTPDMVKAEEWTAIEFPLSGVKAGRVELAFVYQKGKHAIDIKDVQLLKNGKIVSRDPHNGFSGAQLRDVVYTLDVPKSGSDAGYTARVMIKGSAGADSRGDVRLMGGEAETAKIKSYRDGAKKSDFFGFDRYDFRGIYKKLRGYVIEPKKALPGKPWVWRARFDSRGFPAFDKAMLAEGYHIAHTGVGGLLGGLAAMERYDEFYKYLVETQGFGKKPVFEGLSRGGLPIFNWSIRNPDKVSCVYGDAAVCDFKSWPGGKGNGKYWERGWKSLPRKYGITEDELMTYKGNPVDNVQVLAKAGVPVIFVAGGADPVVPPSENALVMKKNYNAALPKGGTPLKVIIKKGVGHHPHGLKDPTPVVEFVKAAAKRK